MIAALLLVGCTPEPVRRPHRVDDTPPPASTLPPSCEVATFFAAADDASRDLTHAFGLGSTVVLDEPGTLVLCDVTWAAGLVVNADVEVIGAGADRTILDGGGVRPVITVGDAASLTLSALTVTGGEGFDGGGVVAVGIGDLTLRDVVFRRNHAAHQGGALFAEGPRSIDLQEVSFEDNDADSAGGAVFVRDAEGLAMIGGAFVGNRAVGDGGAIRIHGTTATLDGTLFEQNHSDDRGGALSADSGAILTGQGLVFTRNSAASRGGGAWVDDEASVSFEDVTMTSNTAAEGGALAARDLAVVEIAASSLTGNGATTVGGALFVEELAELTLRDATLEDNTAFDGAGLFLSNATASVVGGSFFGNVAAATGGAVATSGTSTLTLSSVRVEDNVASDAGGLFVGGGTAHCDDGSTFLRNRAETGGGASVFGAVLSSDDCDFGVGADDNLPADVRLINAQLEVSYGDLATFTCDGIEGRCW